MSLMCTGLQLHPGHPNGQKPGWAESTTARRLSSSAAGGGKRWEDIFIGSNWQLCEERIADNPRSVSGI